MLLIRGSVSTDYFQGLFLLEYTHFRLYSNFNSNYNFQVICFDIICASQSKSGQMFSVGSSHEQHSYQKDFKSS